MRRVQLPRQIAGDASAAPTGEARRHTFRSVCRVRGSPEPEPQTVSNPRNPPCPLLVVAHHSDPTYVSIHDANIILDKLISIDVGFQLWRST
jgi:hypothetical protein